MVFVNILRSLLVVIAVLIAMPIVGIDITVLSVFSCALGIGCREWRPITSAAIPYIRGRALLRLPVQFAYRTELETALRLLLETAAANADMLKDPAPAAALHAFTDSGINLELQSWTENPQQKLAVQTELNLAIYRSFTSNKIEIPIPQREIRIVAETKISPSGLNLS